jgi:hypothetical protein
VTTRDQHRIAAIACGLAAYVLLAGCSSGSSPTRAITSAPHPAGSSSRSAPSASATTTVPVAASTSAGGISVAGGSACGLVTEQDATTALGKDPGPGSSFSSHGSSQCQYGTYQSQFLLVNFTPSQGRAGYDLVHSHQQPGQNVSVVDIAGVGDRAFEVSGPNTAGIYANKGDALVVVTITIQGATSPPKGPVLALAKLAAGRL